MLHQSLPHTEMLINLEEPGGRTEYTPSDGAYVSVTTMST